MQTITLLVAIAEAASSINPLISGQIPRSLQVSKTVILCPPSLVENWNDELLTWVPDGILGPIRRVDSSMTRYQRLEEISDWFEEGGLLLIGYDLFKAITFGKNGTPMEEFQTASKQILQGANIVVADEAHSLKNQKATVTKAALEFRTRSRIALTGSPLANNLTEYYAMINFVAPGNPHL